MSKPASISIEQSSKSHDPDYASPSAWGRAAGGGWEGFVPDSSSAGKAAEPNGRPMVARIRKPLKFRVLNRIVETRERSRTGASSRVRYPVDSDGQTLDQDDAFALDVVDRSVLIVVVIVVMIGVIGVAAMVASVIGH